MFSRTKSEKCCLFCGGEIVGRSDKKFCDDTCRNNYHYRVKDNDLLLIKRINGILLNNRATLKSLCVGQKTIVKKKTLNDKCFDFEQITNLYKTKDGVEYRVVYDYAYKLLNDDNVQLLKFIG